MAKVFPSFDIIMKSRQKPTVGELFLLHYLEENFDSEAEVYFQPYLNGDRGIPPIELSHEAEVQLRTLDMQLRSRGLEGINPLAYTAYSLGIN